MPPATFLNAMTTEFGIIQSTANNGRDGAPRRPRRRAQRQATEPNGRGVSLTTFVPPCGRGRPGGPSLPRFLAVASNGRWILVPRIIFDRNLQVRFHKPMIKATDGKVTCALGRARTAA